MRDDLKFHGGGGNGCGGATYKTGALSPSVGRREIDESEVDKGFKSRHIF